MSVHLKFRNISGKIIHGYFPESEKVQNICMILNQHLNSMTNNTFLISPQKNQLFYKGNETVQIIKEQNPVNIFFYNFNIPIETKKIENVKRSTINIPKSTMNVFDNFKEIKKIGREHQRYYMEYARVVRNTPSDMEERVRTVSQFGYDIDDCREALRDTHFDVNQAVEILIKRHRNLPDEEVNRPVEINTSLSRFSFLYHFNLMMHSSSNESDYDDSTESESETETESENDSDHDEGVRLRSPVFPSSMSNSPRTAILRQRFANVQADEHILSDEGNETRQRSRPIITRPNVHKLRIVRPKKTGQ